MVTIARENKSRGAIMKLRCPATLGALALVIFSSSAVVAERPALKRAETAAIAAVKQSRAGTDAALLWRWETPFPGSHPFGPLPH
jgi:hypothetical protein